MAKKRKIISIKEEKSRFNFGRLLFYITLILFLGSIFYVVFFSGYTAISSIEINGTDQIDKELALSILRGETSGRYLGLFEKNNLLLVRNKKLEEKLEERFKKIEKVKIRKKFPNGLIVGIKERKSALIVCSQENCFMLDGDGLAYSEKDYSLPEVRDEALPVLLDLSGKTINLGKNVLDKEYVAYIKGINEGVKEAVDVEMEKSFETPSRVSTDIRGTTKEGWRIFFNEKISLEKETEMLRIVMDEKIKEQRSNLEYVDLRSENKVYYKLKQMEEEAVEKDESSESEIKTDENKNETKKKKDKDKD